MCELIVLAGRGMAVLNEQLAQVLCGEKRIAAGKGSATISCLGKGGGRGLANPLGVQDDLADEVPALVDVLDGELDL